MEEAEAKKILEWLCNRFKKSYVDYYAHQPDKYEISISFSKRLWHIDAKNSIVLDFNYRWIDSLDEQGSIDHFDFASSEYNLCAGTIGHSGSMWNFVFDMITTYTHDVNTDAKLLDLLFSFNTGIYVMGWSTENIYFIYPNESLEEIKVKMDLEDV